MHRATFERQNRRPWRSSPFGDHPCAARLLEFSSRYHLAIVAGLAIVSKWFRESDAQKRSITTNWSGQNCGADVALSVTPLDRN